MTITAFLSVTTIFVIGIWLGVLIRDCWPKTGVSPISTVSVGLVMASAAVGSVTTLASIESESLNLAARLVAFLLALAAIYVAFFRMHTRRTAA